MAIMRRRAEDMVAKGYTHELLFPYQHPVHQKGGNSHIIKVSIHKKGLILSPIYFAKAESFSIFVIIIPVIQPKRF